MFPHERSLVKKMEGKPFVLIGVNSDQGSAEDIKKKNDAEQITWRSFKNDRGGKGPISTDWSVSGWPTLYLLDGKGVIRKKWVGAPNETVLDEAVEKVVKETEAEKK
jgi:hypothetical protein